jgi:metal-dependent amidase/aminoacylase/carboxypeptidase family protein
MDPVRMLTDMTDEEVLAYVEDLRRKRAEAANAKAEARAKTASARTASPRGKDPAVLAAEAALALLTQSLLEELGEQNEIQDSDSNVQE